MYSSKHAPGKGSRVTCMARKQLRQQDFGLLLEEREDQGIYVKELLKGGLFKMKGLPVMVGDEILQMNDRTVPDDFAGGLPEMEYYIETTLAIQFTVMRNTNDLPASPPPSPSKKRRSKAPVVRSGSLMKLKGILKKPELNGRVVEVLNQNPENQRWSVLVLNNQTRLAVTEDKLDYLQLEKQHNVQAGQYLLLQDLRSKPELNGETVHVLGESNAAGRWKVQVFDVNNPKNPTNGQILSVGADKLVTEDEFWKNSWRRAGWDV